MNFTSSFILPPSSLSFRRQRSVEGRARRGVAFAERGEVACDLAHDLEDAPHVRRAEARVDRKLKRLLGRLGTGARGGELAEEREGGADINVRRLEVNAAAYGAAAGERGVGGVDAVLVVDVLHVRRHARCPQAAAVGESARVLRGVAARARVELVEVRQSAQAE